MKPRSLLRFSLFLFKIVSLQSIAWNILGVSVTILFISNSEFVFSEHRLKKKPWNVVKQTFRSIEKLLRYINWPLSNGKARISRIIEIVYITQYSYLGLIASAVRNCISMYNSANRYFLEESGLRTRPTSVLTVLF